MKRFLSLLIILFIFFEANADAAARIPVYKVDSAFLFFDKSTGEITGFAGEPVDLNIPQSISGYMVTSIGKNAFANCPTLRSVSIPATVTYIGSNAFKYCSELSVVTFEGVVENIPLSAFEETPWATGVSDEFVIAGKTLLIRYNGTASDVFVPDGVKKIAPNAFAYNTSVERIALPEGLIEIGDNAFVHCYNLSGISFPSTLSYIGIGAFDDTIWLRQNSDEFVCANAILVSYNGTDRYVTVPSGITAVGSGAFMYNDNITAVYLPDTVRSINEAAFGQSKSLEAVIIPDSVEWIDDYAFSGSDYVVLFGGGASYGEYYASYNNMRFSLPVAVNINGQGIYFDVSPVIIGSSTYVPMRAVLEEIGISVCWDDAKKSVTAENEEISVTAYLGSNEITVNGEKTQIELTPIMLGGRVMLPVRSFADIFGAVVSWDNSSRSVNIEI